MLSPIPPRGNTTETSVGNNGSRVIGVTLSFRPGGGLRRHRVRDPVQSHATPPSPTEQKPTGVFVATNLLRELGGELFIFFFQNDVLQVGGPGWE